MSTIDPMEAGPLAAPVRQLISRFSIVIPAFTLLGMGVGATLPPGFAAITFGSGIVGIIAFAYFEMQSRQSSPSHEKGIDELENRLYRHTRDGE
ncbi:hypothetical protein [Planctomicrobium sp. SH664]|uniref:hypothetical protein n=1 Tax=Planctomicrobium sp. SH664 TaxID=3448125 RepID=UPI003F5C4027